MFKQKLALLLLISSAGIARAGVGGVIEVNLSTNIVYPGHPDDDVIHAEITLTGDDVTHWLRLVQFDFSLSDVDHQNFVFDYNSSLCQDFNLCGLGYAELNLDGDIPATVFSGLSEDQDLQIELPGDGSAILMGHFEIDTTGLAWGTHQVNVLNSQAADENFGARIDFGFGNGDPITTWSAFNGLLTGGIGQFDVIPEPASLAFVVFGAVAVLRRR